MSMPRRRLDGRGQRGVGGAVGDHDELGVVAAALLAHGLDRDVVLGERRARPRRARPARSSTSRRDVVAGQRSRPSAAPRRSAYADSPAPRTPASRLRATVTRSPSTALAVGRAAGAGAVEHQLAGRLGLDEDRVVGLADAGQRVRSRDHRRVHADRDGRAVGAVAQLADREQLDHAAHLARPTATSAAVTSVMPSR